tara:strand:+ start:210 stop:527 length:318 start_codon:yes stop_codon:yes gene_type:complete
MNKKQWISLGIGLLLSSWYLFSTGTFLGECGNDLKVEYNDMISQAIELDMDTEFINGLRLSSIETQLLINSCLNHESRLGIYSTIIGLIGILFIIMGFMESKKKH